MTRQQFLDNFYLEYDRISSSSAPGYLPEEIQIMASTAQEQLILDRYSPKTNFKQEGFEETAKRTTDLGELVTTGIITPDPISNLNLKNGRYFTMPNTLLTNSPTDYSDVFWIPVYEECLTDILDCTIPNNTTQYTTVEIKEMSYQQWAINKINPFQKPKDSRVVRLKVDQRRVELITDSTYSITSYKVRYIKKPTPIDLVNSLNTTVSQLADYMHRELLEETIKTAYKNTDQFNKLAVEAKTSIG